MVDAHAWFGTQRARGRGMRAVTLVLAGCACAARAAAAQVGAAALAPPYAERSTHALVQEILTHGEDVDPAVFEALGVRRDRAALEALEGAIRALFLERSLDPACAALAHFRGAGELETDAVAFLARLAGDSRPPRARAATRALVRFESAAFDELRALVGEHPDPVCRRIAVRGLEPWIRARRDATALELLFRWHRAPESGTRESLVALLAEFDAPEHVDALARVVEGARPAYDAWIRSAAVAALARMDGDDAAAVVAGALESSSPSVQVAALEVLGERAERAHARQYERLCRADDPAVREAAFRALGAVSRGDREWDERVLRAARGRDYALRTAAAHLLGATRGPDAGEALAELFDDPFFCVRIAALEAAAAARRKELVPALIERLDAEGARGRASLLAALRALTGLDHGAGSTRWRAWWSEEGAEFQLPPAPDAVVTSAGEPAAPPVASGPRTQARFYGLDLDGDHLCFVLDTSGSMATPVGTGTMRIDLVQEELVRAIDALPDGWRFNMIFFADHADPWRRELVEAEAESREEARAFVRRQDAGGGTALYAALELAFADPGVDTIVLLSDGEPSVGRIVEPVEIAERVRHWNTLRRVVIHAVSLPGAGDLLRSLAEESGGRFREVR